VANSVTYRGVEVSALLVKGDQRETFLRGDRTSDKVKVFLVDSSKRSIRYKSELRIRTYHRKPCPEGEILLALLRSGKALEQAALRGGLS
jgi:hypothetical protein